MEVSQTKKLVRVETGYGISGINMFFSVMDIYRLGEMIQRLHHSDQECRNQAIEKLINMHQRMLNAIDGEQESVWDEEGNSKYQNGEGEGRERGKILLLSSHPSSPNLSPHSKIQPNPHCIYALFF